MLAALLLGGAPACYAGLFTDDQAQRKLTEQQKTLDQLQSQTQALDQRLGNIEQMLKNQGLVDLLKQIDALTLEVNKLRGQIEVLTNDVATAQKRQHDMYVDLDTRLKTLEPASQGGGLPAAAPPAPAAGSTAPPAAPPGAGANPPALAAAAPAAVAGPPAAVDPVEARAYSDAYNMFNIGNYQGAIIAFQAFVKNYPAGKLVPNAWYWIGNSYYNMRDFKSAIVNQQKLLARFPDNPKAPDALLNIASSQIELSDSASAKRTLEDIVSKYPASDAAEKAKRRLAALK